MNKVRELTDKGISEWEEFLRQGRLDQYDDVHSSVLTHDDYASVISETDAIPVIPDNARRLEVARAAFAVSEIVEASAQRPGDRLWSWYAAINFHALIKPGKVENQFSSGHLACWIADSQNWKAYYRHRVANPWWTYSVYREYLADTMALLCTSAREMPEIVEQIASRQEIVSSFGTVAAATALYYDRNTGKMKKGAGGKDAGTPRRFADFIKQIDRTYDLGTITKEEILEMLPNEFNKFKQAV